MVLPLVKGCLTVIRYRRDVPASDQSAIDITVAHVRAHLSAVADIDDDPHTKASDVTIAIEAHPGFPGVVSITGVLDAQPHAPYLRSDYQPDCDHSSIRFEPFEQPELGRCVDAAALARFREGRRD